MLSTGISKKDINDKNVASVCLLNDDIDDDDQLIKKSWWFVVAFLKKLSVFSLFMPQNFCV